MRSVPFHCRIDIRMMTTYLISKGVHPMTQGDSLNSMPPGSRERRSMPWRAIGWGSAAALWLTPLVAMRFTEEVAWSAGDFVVFGGMLLVAGALVEAGARASRSPAYCMGVTLAVLTAFLLVWVNLAVGIVGNENNPVNLVFAGVLAVAAAGALVARGDPVRMTLAMVAAAVAQAAISVAVPLLGLGEVPLVAAVFVGLWLAASLLFRRAARRPSINS